MAANHTRRDARRRPADYRCCGHARPRTAKLPLTAPPRRADIKRELKKTELSIKECAKRGDKRSMNVLALELLRTRKAVERLHTSKAQMNSITLHLNENLGASACARRAVRHGS